MKQPTIKDIKQAHERIKPHIHNTPVMKSDAINEMCKAELFFKCENFQKVGAFKMRGATNAVFSLSEDDAEKGVATHSSGNHAAALALAAKKRGIKAYVVMPETAPVIKIKAVESYGAEIIFCKPTLQAREEGLAKVIERTGATFVHPYNNYKVIAGQGTVSLELLQKISGLNTVITPVGGGGLLSGTALTVSELLPMANILAAEPSGADDAFRSLQKGEIVPSVNPNTIADGLLTSLGDKTFPIIKKHVKEIIIVTDKEIIEAMRIIWERMKIIVEPSSAVTLAAIMKERNRFTGKRIGLILSGGNVDLEKLPWGRGKEVEGIKV